MIFHGLVFLYFRIDTKCDQNCFIGVNYSSKRITTNQTGLRLHHKAVSVFYGI